MANFLAYPGRFVEIEEDSNSAFGSHKIVKGDILQVLNMPSIRTNGFTFVGKQGLYLKPKMKPHDQIGETDSD